MLKDSVRWPWYVGSDILLQDEFLKAFSPISRIASQRLGILRKSWRVLHDRLVLRDTFGVLSCQYWLLFCSLVHWITDNVITYLTLYWTSAACFLAGGVFECNIAHHRSVALLCVVYRMGLVSSDDVNRSLPALHCRPFLNHNNFNSNNNAEIQLGWYLT